GLLHLGGVGFKWVHGKASPPGGDGLCKTLRPARREHQGQRSQTFCNPGTVQRQAPASVPAGDRRAPCPRTAAPDPLGSVPRKETAATTGGAALRGVPDRFRFVRPVGGREAKTSWRGFPDRVFTAGGS